MAALLGKELNISISTSLLWTKIQTMRDKLPDDFYFMMTDRFLENVDLFNVLV